MNCVIMDLTPIFHQVLNLLPNNKCDCDYNIFKIIDLVCRVFNGQKLCFMYGNVANVIRMSEVKRALAQLLN